MEQTISLDKNSWMEYGSIPPLQYDFEQLWNLHPREYNTVIIYGKSINTPRYQQAYEKPYYFSGKLHQALPLPNEYKCFYDWAKTRDPYNSVLINWYEHGQHYISKHSDSEPCIVRGSPIMTISLGAERMFRVRAKSNNLIHEDLILKDESYLVMCGEMQQHFTHEIPKTMKECGKRISITFRIMK